MTHDLKCPIDDVNVLLTDEGSLQMWLENRIYSGMHNFHAVDVILNYLHENLAEAPLWKLRVGYITVSDDERRTQITLTVASRKPARARKGDHIGRCVQQGSIEEVWPAFCTYARML